MSQITSAGAPWHISGKFFGATLTEVNSMPDPCSGKGSALTRWTHPSVLLVATDLNDMNRLMPFALEQAAESGARVILLHVLTSAAVISADAAGLPYYDSASAIESVVRVLEPWCEAACRRNIACDGLVREGHAPSQIADVVEQFEADRIVLGTRGRGRLGKLLVGSVAEQVLRSVNIPVFTVGPEAHLPVEDEGRERVVLYATTLSQNSRPSAALAC
ncbi:MAG: universal stress protein, partial [Terracidiphilus sp.]